MIVMIESKLNGKIKDVLKTNKCKWIYYNVITI
jgi:hypothetical protein